MANSKGNPNIALYGKRTQFGQDRAITPARARMMVVNHPSSVRLALRRLMAREIDIDKMDTALSIKSQLAYLSGPQKRLTGAMFCAAIMTCQAMQNYEAMEALVNRLEGKL